MPTRHKRYAVKITPQNGVPLTFYVFETCSSNACKQARRYAKEVKKSNRLATIPAHKVFADDFDGEDVTQ